MKNIKKIAFEILKEAATKPLEFVQYKAFKDAVSKLEKKMKSLIEVDYDKLKIKFTNDKARRDAFDILGKDEIKMFTKWKGPSIWA